MTTKPPIARPLSGVRIVSVEQFGAGPYGTMFLASLGAEVIRVENAAAGGDPARKTGPYFLGPGESHYFHSFNLGKKSVELDLRSDAGKAALLELVKDADALANNLRGDISAKLGLDYKSVAPLKPSIVCVHVSAYGRDNARAARPGYDYLMQAEAGLMDLTGEPDSPPTRMGPPSMIDHSAGLMAAIGLLSGIIQARATGRGCDVDVSLFDAAIHQLSYVATWYLNEGYVPGRQPRSAHYALAPVQTFPSADGWVFVMCMADKFWWALVDALGRADLRGDPRFATQAARRTNRDALSDALDAEFSKQTSAYWVEKLGGLLPVAPVLKMAQALESPFVQASGMIQQTTHPARTGFRVLGNPIKVDGERFAQALCAKAKQ